jgi:hypothetical protein
LLAKACELFKAFNFKDCEEGKFLRILKISMESLLTDPIFLLSNFRDKKIHFKTKKILLEKGILKGTI